jgi:hypothetical protein
MATKMSYQATITGRGPTSTIPDNADAVDAKISADGEILGNVTLLPPEDGRAGLERWGSLDHWADSQLIAHLDDIGEDERDWAIGEIEAAVAQSAEEGAT